MSSRRAYLLADVLVGVATAMFLSALAVVAMQDHHRALQQDIRSAHLELAQNLLARVRRGETPVVPTGWHLRRQMATPGCSIVVLTGPDVRLQTIIRGAP